MRPSTRQILFKYQRREHALARAVEDIDNNVIAVILRIELKAEHLAAAGDRISDRGTAEALDEAVTAVHDAFMPEDN